MNVFTTHLKATTSSPQNDVNRRAAEAGAISNFFVNTYLNGSNALQPYVLTGDLNEDIFRSATNDYVSGQPIQRLTSPPVGLRLTTPVAMFGAGDFTLSIRRTLNVRFDYILPCSLLWSNVVYGQVFRSDLLTNPPPPLLKDDDRTSSDHLPVLMVFRNPFDQPFRLLSLTCANEKVMLSWEAIRGQIYRVEGSADLGTWEPLVSGLIATGYTCSFTTNQVANQRVFPGARHLRRGSLRDRRPENRLAFTRPRFTMGPCSC